jgi:transcription initiation factor TFIID subunit 8
MLSARRALPIPPDFEYALRREGLTDRLLRPHLKPPVPKSKCQIHLELQEATPAPPKPVPELLGKELSGASEKLLKPYIPKKFPDFPSKHTYKATEVMPIRESDPRKIREKATEAARHGEEALRRLVKVGKVSDQKGVRKASEKNSKNRIKHELWVKAMEALSAESPTARKNDDDEELEQSIMVDAGRKYGRKPVLHVRT